MFQSRIVAENTENEIVGQAFFIIGIISIFVMFTMSLIIFGYFALKFIKRQNSESQYYTDDTIIDTNSNEYYDGNNSAYIQIQYLYQIRPILTFSHIYSSIKHSLMDLSYFLIPSKWLHVQHTNNQQNSDNKTMDLPI
ncbi:unnamed protein product [Rotaria sp. Silwood1]|nr:unnamed protein product [Rotaria sp. Silwood1]